MQLFKAIVTTFFATVVTAVTSTLSEMALRELIADRSWHAARHQFYQSGRHRKRKNGNQVASQTMDELLEQLTIAMKKVAAKRRKFKQMQKIVDGYVK